MRLMGSTQVADKNNHHKGRRGMKAISVVDVAYIPAPRHTRKYAYDRTRHLVKNVGT